MSNQAYYYYLFGVSFVMFIFSFVFCVTTDEAPLKHMYSIKTEIWLGVLTLLVALKLGQH